jgi:hypothetical protein
MCARQSLDSQVNGMGGIHTYPQTLALGMRINCAKGERGPCIRPLVSNEQSRSSDAAPEKIGVVDVVLSRSGISDRQDHARFWAECKLAGELSVVERIH